MRNFIGRPGGPGRMVLSMVVLGVLGTLAFVFVNLNARLDAQKAANDATLARTSDIVDVNERVTTRLSQLTDLTEKSHQALDDTRALEPRLQDLASAITPATRSLSSTTNQTGGTKTQLVTIQQVLNAVRDGVIPLTTSAEAFGDQGAALLPVLQSLNSDLRSAVASARRIDEAIPLPETGTRAP